MFLLTLCGSAVAAVLCYLLFKSDPEPKAGVYRLPGKWYWLKRLVFYVLVQLRSRQRKKETHLNDLTQGNFSPEKDSIKGYGKGDGYQTMEKPQPLSSDPFAIDCAYFGGSNKDGCNIAFRLARRHERQAEIWLFLEIPGLGCFQYPRHPDTNVYYTDGTSFSAGGLKFEVLEPMRKWKITYSGKLRKGLCNDVLNKHQELVEATFSFSWNAFSQPFNFDTDLASSLLGDAVAREIWSKEFFQRLKDNHQTHYEQWGELRGRLNIEGEEEQQLRIQCLRDHSFGRRNWREFYRYIIHFIYVESGLTFQLGAVCQPNLLSNIKCGYVSYGNGDIVSMSDIQLDLWEIGEATREPPSSWTFSFTADGLTYKVKATRGTVPVWYHHEDRGGKVMEVFTRCEVNSMKAWGIGEYFYRNPDGPIMNVPPPLPLVSEPSEAIVRSNRRETVLPFTNPACSSSTLVGGKGAQLAQLTSIHKDVNAEVPPGFCLTLKSFELQLQENKSILEAIQWIQQSSVSDLAALHTACHTAVEMITFTDIIPQVKTAVLQALHTYIGEDVDKVHLAIRSSAAGEDGTEASSAGQMETVLGVVGLHQIFEGIKCCWASAYTSQAVEYRRQHGQPIHVLMGVVVQKMVSASSAGVMFTADPVSGSTSKIVINANYGLGESVVSGKADPDTVAVERDPEVLHSTEHLKICSMRAGDKSTCIVETETGGVMEKIISGDNKGICLSESMVLKLATLGIELEKCFGTPRDIEWAVVGENAYLLQCRPITMAESETDDELIHEFDSALTCDNLWLTTSNISEMMPGAVTPLTMSTFRPSIEYGLQALQECIQARRKATHLPKMLPAACGHLFICILDVTTFVMTAVMASKEIMAVNLMGNLLPELSMLDVEKYYGRPKMGLLQRCLNVVGMIRTLRKTSKLTDGWEKRVLSYTVGEGAATAEDLYRCIDHQLADYEANWTWTIINSSQSGNASFILMSMLAGDKPDTWTSDHYGDIALLLSKCDGVFSAGVPQAMERIAREIASTSPQLEEKFLATPDEECIALLDSHPNIKKSIEDFLNHHGHRCLRESELREKSWRAAPEKLMSVLKTVLTSRSYERRERDVVSVSDLLDMLKTKVSFRQRLMLKFYLPKAWKAVGAREQGKSLAVQVSDIFKQAYSRLAVLMHSEGRLPDPDVMYFLTHSEIGTLISTRSARLIIKAQRRRKVLSKQMEMKFEKVNHSHPIPINLNSKTAENINVECLKGMPVSQGEVTGPAQVVHRLEDASVIKSGDILVVSSTDVGWSPYFPLIGGLVTELGGLISHGAVVAREYGIPCVVNVANATSIITSGETLHINGRLGTVQRLDVENKEQ